MPSLDEDTRAMLAPLIRELTPEFGGTLGLEAVEGALADSWVRYHENPIQEFLPRFLRSDARQRLCLEQWRRRQRSA
jgi:hypothetical protein